MRPIWTSRILLNEFDDNEGGGGNGDVSLLEQPGGEGGEGEPDEAPLIDHDALGDAIGRSIASHLPQPGPQQPPLDLATFRKQTGYLEISDEHLNQLFGEATTPEARKKALQAIYDGAVQHALNVTGLVLQQRNQERDAALIPMREYVRDQHVEKLTSNVTTKYGALKQYPQIVKRVIAELRERGYQPKSEADAIRIVAGTAESVIKETIPNFSLSNQAQANGRNMPGMPGMMHGGGSGGRGQSKKGWQDAFEV